MKLSFIILILTLIITSCSARKDIRYFENIETPVEAGFNAVGEVLLMPNDKITITVSSPDNIGVAPFNKTEISYVMQDAAGTTVTNPKPYTVSKEGTIEFPKLGVLNVQGKSLTELDNYLTKILKEYIDDPYVDIEIVNFRFFVLGEVKNPGVYNSENENMTFIEAIAKAGDLTISGKRDNILIIRKSGLGRQFIRLSLLDQQLFTSPGYYIQTNDIIYVEPSIIGSRKEAWETRIGTYTGIFAFILSAYAILSR
ncbi:polysaccharide biosynthesis/export family protein [Aegicerativicinus sediminis]|uniref:polysaccharide biosynthesis/export family protein n=1 Tax=Aegicerativicinus sediminis TaxID=2893202 RepID=UPI001E439290|nr:polysaccharide biosynthesis/export family protein [Aegicerativicinus sediminis]